MVRRKVARAVRECTRAASSSPEHLSCNAARGAVDINAAAAREHAQARAGRLRSRDRRRLRVADHRSRPAGRRAGLETWRGVGGRPTTLRARVGDTRLDAVVYRRRRIETCLSSPEESLHTTRVDLEGLRGVVHCLVVHGLVVRGRLEGASGNVQVALQPQRVACGILLGGPFDRHLELLGRASPSCTSGSRAHAAPRLKSSLPFECLALLAEREALVRRPSPAACLLTPRSRGGAASASRPPARQAAAPPAPAARFQARNPPLLPPRGRRGRRPSPPSAQAARDRAPRRAAFVHEPCRDRAGSRDPSRTAKFQRGRDARQAQAHAPKRGPPPLHLHAQRSRSLLPSL